MEPISKGTIMRTRSLAFAVVLGLFAFAAPAARAQDDPGARQEAADRYLRAVPMARMLEDTYAGIANDLPPDRREAFLAQMRGVVRVEVLERITRDALIKTFTIDELNALADFYGSRHGASAISKFGPYMAEVMPALMEEMRRAMQSLQPPKQ